MRFYVTWLCWLLIIVDSTAQKAEINWKHQLDIESQINAVAPLSDGRYAYVGVVSHKIDKEQALFGIYKPNASEEEQLQYLFGGQTEDEATALIYTFDGGFLVGGNKGKKPWVFKLDEKGEVLWQYQTEGEQAGFINRVAQNEKGDLIAIGQRNDHPLILIFSEQGELLMDTVFKREGYYQAMAMDKRGNLGLLLNSPQKTCFFQSFNLQQRKFSRPKSIRGFQWGEDIIFNHQKEQYLALGGFKKVFERIQTVTINPYSTSSNSIKSFFKLSNTDNTDLGKRLFYFDESNIYIVGYTLSFPEGAKRFSPLIIKINQKNKQHELFYKKIGNQFGNYLFDAQVQADGNLLLGGMTFNKGSTTPKGWILSYDTQLKAQQLTQSNIELSLDTVLLFDRQDTLKYKGRGYIKITAKSKANKSIFQWSAKLLGKVRLGCNILNESVALPVLYPQQEQTIGIPLIGCPNLYSNTVNATLSIQNQNQQIIQSFDNITITTQAPPKPQLIIQSGQFSVSRDTFAKRGEYIDLNITVKNVGEDTARQSVIGFNQPYLVNTLGKNYFEVPNIAPGDSIRQKYTFRILELYTGNAMTIQCIAFEQTNSRMAFNAFTVAVESYFNLPEANPQPYETETLEEWSETYRHGPAPYLSPIKKPNILKIEWLFSDSIIRRGINPFHSKYTILKALIESPNPINQKEIQLVNKHSKRSTKIHIIDSKLISNSDSCFSYVYFAIVDLKRGLNRFRLHVGNQQTSLLKIKYIPPDLHLIGIAPAYGKNDPLQFNQADVIEIEKLFATQSQSELYSNIYTKVDTSFRNTTREMINHRLQYLHKKKYENSLSFIDKSNSIKNSDIILFIYSGHGFIDSTTERLYLVPSSLILDDDPIQEIISYKEGVAVAMTAVLQNIATLACQKAFVIIDACYAGLAAKDLLPNQSADATSRIFNLRNIDRIINNISDMNSFPNKLYLLCSSQANQKSLEIKHGLLIYSILQVLKSRKEKRKHCTQEITDDPFISIKDIYYFTNCLIKEILIAQGLPTNKQHIYIPESHNDETPLLQLK